MSDKQCSSCGGFCGRGGCKRENVKPEQEPVAWLSEGGDVSRSKRYMDEMGFICEPLYTAPPARKPLTDYQIREIDALVWKELSWEEKTFGQFALKLTRAIERAHGIGD